MPVFGASISACTSASARYRCNFKLGAVAPVCMRAHLAHPAVGSKCHDDNDFTASKIVQRRSSHTVRRSDA